MQSWIPWSDLRIFFRCFNMIGHNKLTKAISDNFPNKFCLRVSLWKLETVKILFSQFNIVLFNKWITSIQDWGTYFFGYIFEYYFLWNNFSYVFWNSRVWMLLRFKLDRNIYGQAWFSTYDSVNISTEKLNQVWNTANFWKFPLN